MGECHEEVCTQHNINKNVNHDEGIEEPEIGMTFDISEELADFYAMYGKKIGFGVFKRSSQKSQNDEETKYVTVACNPAQKSMSNSKNTLNPRPITKTNCGARVCAVLAADKSGMCQKLVSNIITFSVPAKDDFIVVIG